MQKEVTSKPMKLSSHDLVPRVFSYHQHSVIKHGISVILFFIAYNIINVHVTQVNHMLTTSLIQRKYYFDDDMYTS